MLHRGSFNVLSCAAAATPTLTLAKPARGSEGDSGRLETTPTIRARLRELASAQTSSVPRGAKSGQYQRAMVHDKVWRSLECLMLVAMKSWPRLHGFLVGQKAMHLKARTANPRMWAGSA